MDLVWEVCLCFLYFTGSALVKNEEPATLKLDSQLRARLECCTNLPSPPAVALRVIEFAQDPDVDIGKVSDLISTDPALAAKVLRVANSPIYALRRKAETIHQAIMLLGLNGTLMLALSFSLASSMRSNADQGFDYNYFWKRSLASATCARRIGVMINLCAKEQLFLACLLQDIGMLVIDKMDPKFYQEVGISQHDHKAVTASEYERLGTDHASVGGWLLRKWGFPKYLHDAVVYSHSPESHGEAGEFRKLMSCLTLSGLLVDAIQNPTEQNNLQVVAGLACDWLGIEEEPFMEIMALLNNDFSDAQKMFDTDLSNYCSSDYLMDTAKEMLVMMNLQTLHQADKLHETAEVLESRTRELEESSRRDGLTGLYNRAYLDKKLGHEFTMASERGWPMIVMFVDIDHFKQVNDTYGHQAGDIVLQRAAHALSEGTRDDGTVARYGGEEFVVVTPGRGEDTAHVMAKRLVEKFRSLRHPVSNGREIVVNISIGVAIQGEGEYFASADNIMAAADKALYAAKKTGRNRYIIYSELMDGDDGLNVAEASAD